jgi:hypothetical protein
MKTFLITLLFIVLFGGCAQQNAFEKFKLSHVRELSENSIKSLKIKDGQRVAGIVNVVYLNKVLPKVYKDYEYFYVYYYIKDHNETASFTLNAKEPLLREELKNNNEFSYLTSFNAPWSKYYLLGFKKEGNKLDLKIQTSKGASATLQFVKDK